MRIVIPDDYQDCLHTLECYAAFAGHEVVRHRQPARDLAHFAELLQGADAVVAVRERSEFPRALLEQLPRLKLISQVGRSVHAIDVAACDELGITVCAGTQASPIAPAEMTWALILATRRNVVLEAERMRRGESPATLSHRLSGSTLGVYGLGTIGQLVARVGPAFGMRVLVWGRDGSRAAAERAGYEFARSREQFFAESDVLSLHVRLSAQTRGMVTAADLALMKPSALLVNTSRATLIEPCALEAGLRAGRPGFAAVDVYEHEPVTGGDHPLLKMPNVVCMPHLAWADRETFELYFGEAFRNVADYFGGRPVNVVNQPVRRR
jgi:D-3-phosphoglycerate dehydrogenase